MEKFSKTKIVRLLALMLALVLALPTFAFAETADNGADVSNFTDVASDSWYKEAVDYSVNHGLVKGVADSVFDPNGTMTRGQVITVMMRLAGYTSSDVKDLDNPFTDCKDSDYYTPAVKWAVFADITAGVSDTSFAPNAPVTREQMATFVSNLIKYYETYNQIKMAGAENQAEAFTDADTVSTWAKESVENLRTLGLAVGDNGKYMPQKTLTRAEGVTFLMRAREAFIKSGIDWLPEKAEEALAPIETTVPVEGTKVEAADSSEVTSSNVTIAWKDGANFELEADKTYNLLDFLADDTKNAVLAAQKRAGNDKSVLKMSVWSEGLLAPGEELCVTYRNKPNQWEIETFAKGNINITLSISTDDYASESTTHKFTIAEEEIPVAKDPSPTYTTDPAPDPVTYEIDAEYQEKYRAEFERLLNKAREEEGLNALEFGDAKYDAVTELRAEELIEKFGHERPDGTDCDTAYLELFFTKDEVETIAYEAKGVKGTVYDWSKPYGGLNYSDWDAYIGIYVRNLENVAGIFNIAYKTPEVAAKDAFTNWMASSGHRAALMAKNAYAASVSVAKDPNSSYGYSTAAVKYE